jgi:hypothetical protein
MLTRPSSLELQETVKDTVRYLLNVHTQIRGNIYLYVYVNVPVC